LLVDGSYSYGTISIDAAKITASNSTVYIPAKLHLGPRTINGSSIKQHFNIEVIHCDLSLLGNFKKSNATDIPNPYSSKNSNHDPDITFEFPLSRSDMKEIENKRKGTDVDLRLDVNFYLEILPHPSSKIVGKKRSFAYLNLKIFRSQWEDTILSAFKYTNEYLQNESEKAKGKSALFKVKEFVKRNWDKILQLAINYFSIRHTK
jgi:hypothetical protein